jgi:Asp-tRNA(Asn)/Glu-tRNA(Gln) amidotransferase C subunit
MATAKPSSKDDKYFDPFTFTFAEVNSSALFSYFKDKDISGDKREEEMLRLISLGLIVTERVQASQDMDFVKRETEGMLNNISTSFNESLNDAYQTLGDILLKGLDPDVDASYLNKMKTWLRDELKTVKDTAELIIKNAKEVSTDELVKIEKGIADANTNFDPAREDSFLGKFKSTIVNTSSEITALLDFSNTDSFAFKLSKEVETYFGKSSPIIYGVQEVIKDHQKNITEELVKLREEIAKQQGIEGVMDKTAIKGFKFEEQLMEQLEEIAEPYGDNVIETGKQADASRSKKGDFIYELKEQHRIVVEAKDEAIGLKPMLKYLDEAMTTRSCDFAILVTKNDEQLPKQVGLFNLYEGNKLFCSSQFVKFAIRWSRLYLTSVKGESVEGLDITKISNSLEAIDKHMKDFVVIKKKLTALSNATSKSVDEIAALLSKAESNINSELDDIETELK